MYVWWIVCKAFWDQLVAYCVTARAVWKKARFQSDVQGRNMVAAQVALLLVRHTARVWTTKGWHLTARDSKGVWLMRIAPWFGIEVKG